MTTAFGYMDHISTYRRHGLIRRQTGTHAATYDGGQLADLIDPSNIWADNAYHSRKSETLGLTSMIRFR